MTNTINETTGFEAPIITPRAETETVVSDDGIEERVRDGITEHRHRENDYWHPTTRVHNPYVCPPVPAQTVPYQTMYDYVKDADISRYNHANAHKDAPAVLYEAFQPIDDENFVAFWDDEIVEFGITYIRVCWGGAEPGYVAESAMYECCYARYNLVDDDDECDYAEYISDGRVYETFHEARGTQERNIVTQKTEMATIADRIRGLDHVVRPCVGGDELSITDLKRVCERSVVEGDHRSEMGWARAQ